MSTDQKEKNEGMIFVYGTLKKGGHFAEGFDGVRIKNEPATIKGTLIRVSGWFPGVLLNGDNTIHGELHTYKKFDKVIERMDMIEGFRDDKKENSLFLRQAVTVITEKGEEKEAIIYTFNRDTKDCQIIEDGVWPLDD